MAAIFFVVHGHGAWLLRDTVLAPVLKNPFSYEVDIFFILTGFLIGGSFISYAEKHSRVDMAHTWRFYIRTAIRILPCYYAMLLVNYLFVRFQIIPGNTGQTSIWHFITLTQNIFTPFYDFY